ncbi:putative F/Y-rich N-terminus [Lyophyllum shimeji]|uniref:F/Y-rich N-terminus n=1 Tax=Lyophyllum shimeji TaxID=47721 RepID=A0A9P3PMK6_LYOSH|nr:putative F/Y-rich N-terminus [Lyophyllum shimeji]
MSRRSSGSSGTSSVADRDVVMGPRPTPGSSSGSQPKPKDTQEISEKYRKLKRRFFELEEKHKETSTELQRSGERNVKMREERNMLLDRIIELERENPSFNNGRSSTSPPSLHPSSSAFPRTMLDARTRPSSVGSVRDMNAEGAADDDVNPIATSRYPDSEARTRDDEDHAERHEAARDSRNGDRRNGGAFPHLSSSRQGIASPSNHHNAGASSSSSSSRDHSRQSALPGNQSLYTYSPQPHSPSTHNGHHSPSPSCDLDVEMSDGRGYHKEARNNEDLDQNVHTQDPSGSGRAQADSEQPPSGQQERTPGPSRSTRRSSRVAAANQDRADREADSEHTPRTRRAAKRGLSSSPAVATRRTRRESAALAAAGKPEAQPESASTQAASSTALQTPMSASAPMSAPPTHSAPSATGQDTRTSEVSGGSENTTQQRTSPGLAERQYASSSTSPVPPTRDLPSARAPGDTPASQSTADPNIDPALAGAESGVANSRENGSGKESSPMDNIVRVAEAAVAAQKAASASQNSSTAPSTSASPVPSQTPPSATPGSSGSGSSTSSTAYNPYMAMVPGKGMASPTGMMPNPYAIYYPPSTPGTPTSPYPYPYANPYYYLTGPMPGPSGIYPPHPNLVPPPSAQRQPAEAQRQAKPKRLKAHTVTSKHFNIPMVPRDKRGKPMLPLNVGIMTVICLGEVCMREHFHTERYIFPVGYEVTRRYLSTVDPNAEVVYHCTILDGGDGPKFQIVPSDVPDRPVIAGTATGAWSSIVKQANAIRNRQHSNSVSGPDFFGLGQNTIKHLIQELPNADRLRDYVWQTFVEGGPLGGRHAAVIPALPEEYDAAMPIGAYYPTDRDKRKRESTGTPEAPSPKGLAHYPQHIIAQAEAQRAQQQALQQAQQMGAQPLKPEESSGLQQPQAAAAPPGQPSGAQVGLPPLSGPGPASFHDYRPPQPATSAARTPRAAPAPGALPAVATGPSVPATFASIMNAYPASGAAPPPPSQ